MKTHVFRGKRYRIVTGRMKQFEGWCDSPHQSEKTLKLTPAVFKGDRLNDLETCIHEALHACLWDLDEESVEETATSIARFIWRLGWRKKAA